MKKKKKKIGRPKVADRFRRVRYIPVRYSGEEVKAIGEAAKKAGMAKSTWIRRILCNAAGFPCE